MKNKFLKVFFITLIIFLCSSVLITSAAGDRLYTYDDRSVFIDYSSRSVTITSVGYNGTASRLARANNAMFEFYGTELYIYALTYTSSGRARVYIDGEAVGYTQDGTSTSYRSILAFMKTDLSPGKHECSIEAWDSTVINPSTGASVTAYFYLDKIEVTQSLDTEEFFQFYLMAASTIFLGLWLIGFVIKFVLWRLYPDD